MKLVQCLYRRCICMAIGQVMLCESHVGPHIFEARSRGERPFAKPRGRDPVEKSFNGLRWWFWRDRWRPIYS